MTFLVALAMGTMYCVTVIQFIPEALGKGFDWSWRHNLDILLLYISYIPYFGSY